MIGLASLVLALLGSVSSRASEEERWYVVMMQGQKAGWMVERLSETSETITSTTEMRFSVGRGDVGVELRMLSEFVETRDHEPISMRSLQQLGAMPMETRYQFDGKSVIVTTLQGERESERTIDRPRGEWMTPTQAGEFFRAQHDAGVKQITMTTIEALSGLDPVTSTISIHEETPIEVMGKTVMALECTLSQSIMPGIEAKQYMTPDGRIVRSTISMGGIEMIVMESDREVATAPSGFVEIMVSTFVRPSAPIDNPRRVGEGHYVLRVEEGQLPRVPDTGTQVVQKQDDRSATLVVNSGGRYRAQDADHLDARYTSSSSMIDIEDTRIKELVREALRGSSPKETAQLESLRRFVHTYIEEKSLGVGFASASEVARVREGDCTEHAVLLAALARAAGYPTRVASGLIYVDEFLGESGIFGYHAWTQVLIKDKGQWTWVDLDATLDAGTPFDAAHICLGTSGLQDGDTVNSMASLATIMGQLSVEVVRTR
jgi:hypothetical protein